MELLLFNFFKIWLNDFDAAKIDFAKVIKAIGDWELPISYSSFPTNRIDLYSFTTAKLRAYTGLTAIYIFKEEYEKAQLWQYSLSQWDNR